MKMPSTTPSQLLVLVAALLWHATNAMPFFVLNENNSVKCITVPYPANNKIVVSYEFLDFRMSLDNVEIVIRPTAFDDDDDSYMDDEYDDDDDGDHVPDDDHVQQAAKTQNYKVPKKSGTIDFHIHHHGPRLQICVYGNKQGREMPRTLFVSLRVTAAAISDVDVAKFFDDDYMNGLMVEYDNLEANQESNLIKKEEEKINQKQGHAHLTSMEKSIVSMVRDVDNLQNYAKAHKTLEGKFFSKSKGLYSSIKIWPALHILVLIVTGFVQARHMMNFFKSQRVM